MSTSGIWHTELRPRPFSKRHPDAVTVPRAVPPIYGKVHPPREVASPITFSNAKHPHPNHAILDPRFMLAYSVGDVGPLASFRAPHMPLWPLFLEGVHRQPNQTKVFSLPKNTLLARAHFSIAILPPGVKYPPYFPNIFICTGENIFLCFFLTQKSLFLFVSSSHQERHFFDLLPARFPPSISLPSLLFIPSHNGCIVCRFRILPSRSCLLTGQGKSQDEGLRQPKASAPHTSR